MELLTATDLAVVPQEQALAALRAAAEEATAAAVLPHVAQVERAKTGTLITAARRGSPSTPCWLAEEGGEPQTKGDESA